MFNGPWLRELARMPWGIILIVAALAGFGMVILYSAAGGSLTPWALKHGMRFVILLTAALLIALLVAALVAVIGALRAISIQPAESLREL